MYARRLASGHEPVSHDVRLGLQTEASVWKRVNIVPSEAMRSRCGVTGGLSPAFTSFAYAPASPQPQSSARTKARLGFAAAIGAVSTANSLVFTASPQVRVNAISGLSSPR